LTHPSRSTARTASTFGTVVPCLDVLTAEYLVMPVVEPSEAL